jgi:hypothetical protein
MFPTSLKSFQQTSTKCKLAKHHMVQEHIVPCLIKSRWRVQLTSPPAVHQDQGIAVHHNHGMPLPVRATVKLVPPLAAVCYRVLQYDASSLDALQHLPPLAASSCCCCACARSLARPLAVGRPCSSRWRHILFTV